MTSSPNRTKVFISYSHKDIKFLQSFLPHLRNYERNKLIDFWDDTKIKPGAEWQKEIENALASAIVAVLLISVDFLDSQYIQDNELPTLLTSTEKEGGTILPVILRPCSLPESLSRFQAVNSTSMPVAKMRVYQRDELWVKVTNAIVEAMGFQKDLAASIQKQSDFSSEVVEVHKTDEEQVSKHEESSVIHQGAPPDIGRVQKVDGNSPSYSLQVQEEPVLGNDFSDQQYLIKQGVEVWNKWRQKHPDIKPNLSEIDLRYVDLRNANLEAAILTRANLRESDLRDADLRNANLEAANLGYANLRNANLEAANLAGANLRESDLRDADLHNADLRSANLYMAFLQSINLEAAILTGADLSGANLSRANLIECELSEANLIGANLTGVNLSRANLSEVDLQGANLKTAILSETNLENANLTNCLIYGVSAWDVHLQGAKQTNLVITLPDQPTITVDNLEVAQFIYLLLNIPEIRNVIDTITKKTVLILGRFSSERKAVLDTLRDELRTHGYLPVLFDFDKPSTRDLTEIVSTLAHLARFVIADITDAKSILQELMILIPNLPSVPVQPLILESQYEYGMFEHFTRFPWVLPLYRYTDQANLLTTLNEHIIEPAEQKAQELEKR